MSSMIQGQPVRARSLTSEKRQGARVLSANTRPATYQHRPSPSYHAAHTYRHLRSKLQRLIRLRVQPASSMRLTRCQPCASHPKPTHSRPTRLPHDAAGAVMPAQPATAIQRRGGGRETRYGGDRSATAEAVVVPEERAEGAGDTATGRGECGKALADVAVGRAGAEARGGRVEGLHVWHGLFDAEGGRGLGDGRGEVGGGSTGEGVWVSRGLLLLLEG
jgi:hypothetical protein